MQRTLRFLNAMSIPIAHDKLDGFDHVGFWRRALPFWRYAVWLVSLFAVLVVYVSNDVEMDRLTKDMHRQVKMESEAKLLNDRLRLELAARRRALAAEAAASALSLGADDVRVVRVVE